MSACTDGDDNEDDDEFLPVGADGDDSVDVESILSKYGRKRVKLMSDGESDVDQEEAQVKKSAARKTATKEERLHQLSAELKALKSRMTPAQVRLLDVYEALDAACSLLKPRGVLCTMEKIQATVRSIHGSVPPMSQVRLVAQLGPDMLALHHIQMPQELMSASQEHFIHSYLESSRLKRATSTTAQHYYPREDLAAQHSANLGPHESEFTHLEIVFPHLRGPRRGVSEPDSLLKRKTKFAKVLLKGPPLPVLLDEESATAISVPSAPSVPSQPSNSAAAVSDALNAHSFIDHLTRMPFYDEHIVHVEDIPSREAELCDVPAAILHADLPPALEALGYRQLFSHQAVGIDAVQRNKHVIVATSTSSGKSLIYNTCAVDRILRNRESICMYMFPTKALAQDQLRALNEFLEAPPLFAHSIHAATFDGDTSKADRDRIRESASILLTNPDMLHVGVLPQHKNWPRLFRSLRLVVLDEAHVYSGAFGSHVSCVLRRLVRLCKAYGSSPQFVCCSATIANPRQLMSELIGVDEGSVAVVDRDGSPSGHKKFVFWDPNAKLWKALAAAKLMKQRSGSRGLQEASSAGVNVAAETNDEDVSVWRAIFEPYLAAAQARVDGEAVVSSKSIPGADTVSEASMLAPDAPSALLQTSIFDDGIGELQADLGVSAAPPMDAQTSVESSGDATGGETRSPSEYDQTVGQILVALRDPAKRARLLKSPHVAAALIMSEAVKMSVRTITFCRVRKVCELILRYTHRFLSDQSRADLLGKVTSYRGGYSAADRRRIERGLFHGSLTAVTATNALELGVDIGTLDVTMHVGFPGSLSSLWQQAGRSGRKQRDSTSIFISYASPIDQYFARHPSELFSRPCEAACIDPSNESVLWGHLLCAAAEIPLSPSRDAAFFGPSFSHVTSFMLKGYMPGGVPSSGGPVLAERNGVLVQTYLIEFPAGAVGIRNIDSVRFKVINEATGECLDEIDKWRAFFEIHDGAIYMHQGNQYLVRYLDLESMTAFVKPCVSGYYTSKSDRSDIITFRVLKSAWASRDSSGGWAVVDRPVRQSEGDEEGARDSMQPISPPRKLPMSARASSASIPASRPSGFLPRSLFAPSPSSSLSSLLSLPLTAAAPAPKPEPGQVTMQEQEDSGANALDVPSGIISCNYSKAKSSTIVEGYKKVWQKSNIPFDWVPLDLPAVEFETYACWIDISPRIKRRLEFMGREFRAGCHAASHALLGMVPLFLSCDPQDLDVECVSLQETRSRPLRLLLYDTRPGGVGLALKAFSLLPAILETAYKSALECVCETGCPSCVHGVNCCEFNAVSDKAGALEIMKCILFGCPD